MNRGKSQILKAVLLGAFVTVAFTACGQAPEKVFSRTASPDASMEAVWMRCRNPADPSVSALTGAVFTQAGKGCRDVETLGIASFTVTNAPDVDDPGAVIAWVADKVVYDIAGEREITARQANGNAALDLIQIKGNFEGADIMDDD